MRKMLIKMDEDLKSVAEFMQRNLATSKLIPVAEALAGLAPLLWQQDEFNALRLVEVQSASEPKDAIQ